MWNDRVGLFLASDEADYTLAQCRMTVFFATFNIAATSFQLLPSARSLATIF